MGHLTHLWREKKVKYVFWDLIYKLWNQLWILQKKNNKFSEFNSFCYLQWHIWNEKLNLLDLLMKYENGKSTEAIIVTIGLTKCHLCHFKPGYISFGLTPLLYVAEHIKCIYWTTPMYLQSSWIKPYLNKPWNPY